MSETRAERIEHSVVPQFPPRGGGEPGDRAQPRQAPQKSYATNRLALIIDGRATWLSTQAPATATEPPLKGSATADIAGDAKQRTYSYISAWNPRGGAATFEENQDWHWDLVDDVENLGVEYLDAVTMAQHGEWIEHGLALIDVDISVADELAKKYLQSAWIHIDSTWQVHSCAEDVEAASFSWSQEAPGPVTCPVRNIGAHVDRCVEIGGPWGSAAMEASAVWRHHRDIATNLLGCGVCGLVRDDEGGYPITLRTICLGSRHGGYAFGFPIDPV
jgi:Protein of unknown function (DUF3293)